MKKLILIGCLFMVFVMQGCVAYVRGEDHDRGEHHEHHDHDNH